MIEEHFSFQMLNNGYSEKFVEVFIQVFLSQKKKVTFILFERTRLKKTQEKSETKKEIEQK